MTATDHEGDGKMNTVADTSGRTFGVDESRAMAAIDAALGAATHRGAFTHDEVVGVLHDVLTQIQGGHDVEPALDVVDRTLQSIEGQAVVDRGRVVDALLDLRLALEPLPTVV